MQAKIERACYITAINAIYARFATLPTDAPEGNAGALNNKYFPKPGSCEDLHALSERDALSMKMQDLAGAFLLFGAVVLYGLATLFFGKHVARGAKHVKKKAGKVARRATRGRRGSENSLSSATHAAYGGGGGGVAGAGAGRTTSNLDALEELDELEELEEGSSSGSDDGDEGSRGSSLLRRVLRASRDDAGAAAFASTAATPAGFRHTLPAPSATGAASAAVTAGRGEGGSGGRRLSPGGRQSEEGGADVLAFPGAITVRTQQPRQNGRVQPQQLRRTASASFQQSAV